MTPERRNYIHIQDIVICNHALNFDRRKCISVFSLIGEEGNKIGAGSLGLLISNGGTVCDDGFGDYSADAICRKMGHIGHIDWSRGKRWSIQTSRDITLDEVKCKSGDWDSCSYEFFSDCTHDEDIFLKCEDPIGQ